MFVFLFSLLFHQLVTEYEALEDDRGLIWKELRSLLVLKLGSSPGEIRNCLPYMEGKKRLKKEAKYSSLVVDPFNKQDNLHTRLALDNHKISRSLHLPTRILKIYREDLTWFSPLFNPDSLSNALLSQGCILEIAPCVGMMGKTYILSMEMGVRNLSLTVWVQLGG